jgi:hypothetical protein
MAALERIPPQLDAPQEAAETAREEPQRAEPHPAAPGTEEVAQSALGGGGGLEDGSNVRGVVMTTNDEERLIESSKLEFEMHKHFTTVLAALGVVLLTILRSFLRSDLILFGKRSSS